MQKQLTISQIEPHKATRRRTKRSLFDLVLSVLLIIYIAIKNTFAIIAATSK